MQKVGKLIFQQKGYHLLDFNDVDSTVSFETEDSNG